MGEVHYLLFKNPRILFHHLLSSLPVQSLTAFRQLYPKHTCPQGFVSMVITFHLGVVTSLWGDDFFSFHFRPPTIHWFKTDRMIF